MTNERRAAYQRAAAAGERWAGIPPMPYVTDLQRQAVDLAMDAPAIDLRWLKRNMTSTALVGAGVAVWSYCPGGPRTVIAPPIVDRRTGRTVFHELGHHRASIHADDPLTRHLVALGRGGLGSTLVSESLAWAWAMQHLPTWTDADRVDMTGCLRTYMHRATLKEIIGVQVAEHLCSETVYRLEQHRRAQHLYAEAKAARDLEWTRASIRIQQQKEARGEYVGF